MSVDAVPPRRLRIVVGSLPIEDGSTRPPVVGEVDHYLLTFHEADDDHSPMVTTIRARAEPQGDGSPLGPGRQWDGTPHDGPVTWPTMLHGDGWSARWSAPRPVIGEVLVRGVLGDDFDIDARTGVRGRVERVQVITETIDTSADDQRSWSAIASERRLRDVEVAPRWFDRGLVLPPGAPRGGFSARVPADPYVVETGVLVDLDLDHVPALPLRPSIVPGSLDAAGDDLWVADKRLPLVVRLHHPSAESPEVTAFRWDGRILGRDERRAVHADLDGCWVTGSDGIHRVDDDGVRQVDDGRAGFADVHGDTLLAGVAREPGRTVLCRCEPDGTRTDVELADRGLLGLVTGGDGVVLALTAGERQASLAALDPSGALREGPPVELGRTWDRLVAGDPPLVRDGASGRGELLRPVRGDLTLGDGSALGRMMLRVVGTAGRLFVALHPPHPVDIERRGDAAYWPLSGPPAYPDDRQYWLLTELAPGTLEPITSALVPRPPDHVAVGGDGTVWVLADGVRHLPADDGAAAIPLDVAALFDRSP